MSDRGYSLVELLVSVGILLVVLGSVCQLASPAHATALVQAELQDMQQRARVLADRLTFDVRLAGAGTTSGLRRGPLMSSFAAILPAACCGVMADPPGSERTDRLTILYVPRASPEAITGADIAPGSLRLDLVPGDSCPPAPLCGFVTGDLLVVFDDGGYDAFRLDVSSGVPMLEALTPAYSARHAAGSTVARIVIRTYLRDAASNQVLVADGDGPPEPFVDRVTNLQFEYSDAAGASLTGRLGDGPWLGAGETIYDADVRRVRRVHVSYSIRSGLPGTGVLRIPDLTSSFDVALRNVPGGS